MKDFGRLSLRLLNEEEGQATTEYILLLTIGLTMAISVVKKFIQPYLASMATKFSAQLQGALFNKANMHTFRVSH